VVLKVIPKQPVVTSTPVPVLTTKVTVPLVPNHGLPVRLQIPSIKVDAAIGYMGRTETGNMAVPNNIVDVGWYKYGPLPGNTGSAVIAGHIDGNGGKPGVFINLDKLQVGDTILVLEGKGQTSTFIVKLLRTYGQDEQPPEVFTSSTGAHLNLITCSGAWDRTQHHFLERLVVFADKT
jgi:sortase A